jgi:predicted TIM-barrel fold metal-dependent hydrolase
MLGQEQPKEQILKPVAFYDAHCHALTLSHPNFLSFIETARNRKMESIYAQMSAPDYLVGAIFTKGGESMRNMLAVMENDVGSLFMLMEDDLLGKYAKPGDPPPLLAGGELVLGRLRFDKLVIVPLIMDFARKDLEPRRTYYDKPPAKPVSAQVRDVLIGIRDYRRARPQGFLEVRPFLGINTANYSPESLSALLETAFNGYERGTEAATKAFGAMKDFEFEAEPGLPLRFAGVKVYPPLGFDPWPEEGGERDKVNLLYSFCEKRGIPITSHCDDQGFRVIALEKAWGYTSPARWRKVLEAHPSLRLDLAHFGMQYSRPLVSAKPASSWSLKSLSQGARNLGQSLGQSLTQPTEWRDEIIRLMLDYPNFYTDISFNGSEASYYAELIEFLGRLGRPEREVVEERVMFGSDFMVNLTKIRSYADYYRFYANSELPDEWKRRFGHDNPERFLTGE